MSDEILDFGQVFQHLPAPCMVLDQDMRIVTATDAYLEIVQRSLCDLRGRYVFDAFPEQEERLSLFRDAFRRALNGEANNVVKVPFSIPVESEDGTEFREIWWTCTHTPIRDRAGEVRFMVQNAQDVTQQVNAERLKDAIAAELQHRVGNLLGLVSVIARRTAASSDDLEDFLKRFEGRIRALSETHSFLTGNNWDRMTIQSILSRQLADYCELGGHQIAIQGATVELNATEAQVLTLAVHELTTNSVKYGALKTGEGQLNVSWNRTGVGFDLEWHESNIRVESAPTRSGFGSMILDEIVPRQLQAEAVREFGDGSFLYRLTVSERANAG